MNYLLDNASQISLFNTNGEYQISNHVDAKKYKLVGSKNWVFEDTGDEYHYLGNLEGNKLSLCEPPQELIDLYQSN